MERFRKSLRHVLGVAVLGVIIVCIVEFYRMLAYLNCSITGYFVSSFMLIGFLAIMCAFYIDVFIKGDEN